MGEDKINVCGMQERLTNVIAMLAVLMNTRSCGSDEDVAQTVDGTNEIAKHVRAIVQSVNNDLHAVDEALWRDRDMEANHQRQLRHIEEARREDNAQYRRDMDYLQTTINDLRSKLARAIQADPNIMERVKKSFVAHGFGQVPEDAIKLIIQHASTGNKINAIKELRTWAFEINKKHEQDTSDEPHVLVPTGLKESKEAIEAAFP